MTASAVVKTAGADNSEPTALYNVLQGKYGEYIQAAREKNVPGILSLLTPDFVWTLVDGSAYDLLQTEAMLREQFQMIDALEQMTITILEFSEGETEATVVLREDSKGINKAIEASRFVTIETVREMWKKTSEGWQIKTATVLQSQTLSLPPTAASS